MPLGCEGPCVALNPQLRTSILSYGYDQEIINSYLMRIQTGIFTTAPPVLLFSGSNQDPQGDFEKALECQACFQSRKLRKPIPRLQKNTKSRASNYQKTVFAKTWFLQYAPNENLGSARLVSDTPLITHWRGQKIACFWFPGAGNLENVVFLLKCMFSICFAHVFLPEQLD